MKPQDFLQAAEQLNLLKEYVSTAITGKGKADKINISNQYIESATEAILKSLAESSLIIKYEHNGREFVDFIDRPKDRDMLNFYLSRYSRWINISWEDFQRKYKNILDLSRYKPTNNDDIITYSDN